MNRPLDPFQSSGSHDEDWESALESDFFDEPVDTLDAAPARVEPVSIEPEPVVEQPWAEPEAAWGGDTDDIVIQVVPRWVWPTLGLMGALAIGGLAFGLGVMWASPSSDSTAVVVAEAPIEQAQTAAVKSTEEEVPVVEQKASKKRAVKKKASKKRRRRAKPKNPALEPSAAPAVAAPHVPAAPAPPVATTPLSPADLPPAVNLGALKPGAAL